MRLDRNICKECGEKNFNDSEYNIPLGKCNKCFLKHYEQMQKRVLEIEKNKVWIDGETELMWELKQKKNIAETYTWDESLNYAKELNKENYAGYGDWRVPTIKELQTLVDFIRYNPAIKEPLADNVASSNYWSSSEYVSDTSKAWVVNFYNGSTYWNNKSNKNYVRCVRGRQ